MVDAFTVATSIVRELRNLFLHWKHVQVMGWMRDVMSLFHVAWKWGRNGNRIRALEGKWGVKAVIDALKSLNSNSCPFSLKT